MYTFLGIPLRGGWELRVYWGGRASLEVEAGGVGAFLHCRGLPVHFWGLPWRGWELLVHLWGLRLRGAGGVRGLELVLTFRACIWRGLGPAFGGVVVSCLYTVGACLYTFGACVWGGVGAACTLLGPALGEGLGHVPWGHGVGSCFYAVGVWVLGGWGCLYTFGACLWGGWGVACTPLGPVSGGGLGPVPGGLGAACTL